MLFQWVASGDRTLVIWDEFLEVGKRIRGLTYKRVRPSEVLLSKDDFKFLIENPKYLQELYHSLS